MSKERVIPQAKLDPMLDRLREALECGNRVLVRRRLVEFLAEEHDEGQVILAMPRAGASGLDG